MGESQDIKYWLAFSDYYNSDSIKHLPRYGDNTRYAEISNSTLGYLDAMYYFDGLEAKCLGHYYYSLHVYSSQKIQGTALFNSIVKSVRFTPVNKRRSIEYDVDSERVFFSNKSYLAYSDWKQYNLKDYKISIRLPPNLLCIQQNETNGHELKSEAGRYLFFNNDGKNSPNSYTVLLYRSGKPNIEPKEFWESETLKILLADTQRCAKSKINANLEGKGMINDFGLQIEYSPFFWPRNMEISTQLIFSNNGTSYRLNFSACDFVHTKCREEIFMIERSVKFIE